MDIALISCEEKAFTQSSFYAIVNQLLDDGQKTGRNTVCPNEWNRMAAIASNCVVRNIELIWFNETQGVSTPSVTNTFKIHYLQQSHNIS